MPARQDASGGGRGGASAAASPTKPAPSQRAKGKGKARGDDLVSNVDPAAPPPPPHCRVRLSLSDACVVAWLASRARVVAAGGGPRAQEASRAVGVAGAGRGPRRPGTGHRQHEVM